MHIPSKYLRPSRIDATHKSVIICISSPNSVITLKMHTDPEHFRDKARGHRPRLQSAHLTLAELRVSFVAFVQPRAPRTGIRIVPEQRIAGETLVELALFIHVVQS